MSADIARRAAASRKGAAVRKQAAALRAALAGGPPLPAPAYGSRMLQRENMSIPAILARIKAREDGA